MSLTALLGGPDSNLGNWVLGYMPLTVSGVESDANAWFRLGPSSSLLAQIKDHGPLQIDYLQGDLTQPAGSTPTPESSDGLWFRLGPAGPDDRLVCVKDYGPKSYLAGSW